MKYKSSNEVALILGVSPRRVRQLASKRKVGFLFGHIWWFEDKDIDRMKIRVSGRSKKHNKEIGLLGALLGRFEKWRTR